MPDQTQGQDVRAQLSLAWAQWSWARFRFRHPELRSQLFQSGDSFVIYVENPSDQRETLAHEFAHDIRAATAPVKLVWDKLSEFTEVPTPNSLSKDAWLAYEPLPAPELSRLISLVEPNLPHGYITFGGSPEGFYFIHRGITSEQELSVRRAAEAIGIPGVLTFNRAPDEPDHVAEEPRKVVLKPIRNALDVPASRELASLSYAPRRARHVPQP